MNYRTKQFACLFAVCLILFGWVPARAEYIIDDFSEPGEVKVRVISWKHLNPTLVETPDPGILGEERDILLEVDGTAGFSSFIGEIGGGSFVFGGSSPGTAATIQYDGADDADDDGPPAALFNSEGLGGVDLTVHGDRFALEFLSIDGGQSQWTKIEIEVHSSSMNIAMFDDTIWDSAGPKTYVALFGSFSDASVFTDVASIEFRINPINPDAADDVDFELDTISIVPEPSAMALSALGLVCLLGFAWRRRK